MSGVYIQTADDQKGTCFVDDFATPFCMQAVRNNPLSSDPAFVLWPTTVDHVKSAVAFAAKHNLCLAVAGTGHDFLNRHSCSDTPGVLLRMSLFKNVTVNLNDTRHTSGTITLGAGMVFSEAHYHASLNKRYVASGWVGSVGVVGWSIGGGHGPYSGAAGLGVDNIVEAQLVLANDCDLTGVDFSSFALAIKSLEIAFWSTLSTQSASSLATALGKSKVERLNIECEELVEPFLEVLSSCSVTDLAVRTFNAEWAGEVIPLLSASRLQVLEVGEFPIQATVVEALSGMMRTITTLRKVYLQGNGYDSNLEDLRALMDLKSHSNCTSMEIDISYIRLKKGPLEGLTALAKERGVELTYTEDDESEDEKSGGEDTRGDDQDSSDDDGDGIDEDAADES